MQKQVQSLCINVAAKNFQGSSYRASVPPLNAEETHFQRPCAFELSEATGQEWATLRGLQDYRYNREQQ